mmetsp:Transcript_57577/g.135495  ORF Transcript_57577/g.135495 Transcript_57577/m.135495 type:complete len:286 (-) Transcript_57577:926-1783(-)
MSHVLALGVEDDAEVDSVVGLDYHRLAVGWGGRHLVFDAQDVEPRSALAEAVVQYQLRGAIGLSVPDTDSAVVADAHDVLPVGAVCHVVDRPAVPLEGAEPAGGGIDDLPVRTVHVLVPGFLLAAPAVRVEELAEVPLGVQARVAPLEALLGAVREQFVLHLAVGEVSHAFHVQLRAVLDCAGPASEAHVRQRLPPGNVPYTHSAVHARRRQAPLVWAEGKAGDVRPVPRQHCQLSEHHLAVLEFDLPHADEGLVASSRSQEVRALGRELDARDGAVVGHAEGEL